MKGLGLPLLLAVVASLLIAPSAGAATIHQFESGFKMVERNETRPGSIAIDEDAERLYVVDTAKSNLQRFDLAGNPVNWPGVPGPNELQSINFESSDPPWELGDTFTLTCPNSETTAPIQFAEPGETGSNIKSALEAKCGGAFSLSGYINWTVEYQGSFASTNVPKMTCATASGSGKCEVGGEQNGAPETNALPVGCSGTCSSVAVDNSGGPNQGVIYVGSDSFGGQVQVHLPDGKKVGPIKNVPGDPQFGTQAPCGVAVDTEGSLYVTHAESQIPYTYVDRYAPLKWSTNPEQNKVPETGTIRPLDFNSPCRTAIDSSKSLLISSGSEFTSTGTLHRFAPNSFGPPQEPFTPGTSTEIVSGARGPAVDISDDNVYVPISKSIARFDSDDSPVEEFGGGELGEEIGGIGVNGQTGKVYVSDGIYNGPREVKIYKAILVPDALTEEATGVLHSTATLHGHVDPAAAGQITGCEFQYVKDSLYNASKFAGASSVPCQPSAPLNAPADVSADLSGLDVEEGFHYRLRASNADGTSNGTIRSFMTRAVLEIETKAATDVAPRSATLNGSFTGEGAPTEYFYEWGTNQGYGNSTPVQTVPSPSGTTQAPQALPALELETLYHYRVVAINSTGTSRGDDMTFTTDPAVTALQTKPATSLDPENITLNAEFQGDGLDTKYFFEYGLTTEYGNETPEQDAGVTSAATPISAEVEQFNGFRTYHYRVVAVNSFGETRGPDMTFVAPDTPKPGIGNTQVVSVSPTSATVSSEVNPNHWETIYLFEWGDTHAFGTATPFSDPIGGLGNEPIEVTQELTGLTPGTLYFFRAVASNFRGTTNGEEVSFTTPAQPRIDSAVAESVGKTSAHLRGLVAAMGSAASVSFQYGPTATYGRSTPEVPIGQDLIFHRVDADVGSLTPGTTYHFRVAATNAIGTTYGPDKTFTTAAEPPVRRSTADCDGLSQRAQKKIAQAQRLRGKAKSAKGNRAKALRRQAKSASKQGAKLNQEADACRSTSGGSGT